VAHHLARDGRARRGDEQDRSNCDACDKARRDGEEAPPRCSLGIDSLRLRGRVNRQRTLDEGFHGASSSW
jgi:hypothetical protein